MLLDLITLPRALKKMQNLCLLQCKKKLVELQNQFLFRLIFNGTIFLNKFAYHNDVPITEEKKIFTI